MVRDRGDAGAARFAPPTGIPWLNLGDVLATMEPDTWIRGTRRALYYRLMWAAVAALAVCARLVPSRICGFTLADWDAGDLTYPTRCGRAYPIILLPVAKAAIDRYLVERRKVGGTALLAGPDGKPIHASTVSMAFYVFERQYGIKNGLYDGLIAFYDRCLVHEPDRAAVVALRHGTGSGADETIRRSDIYAAAADRDRLTRILERRHRLAGAAGRWLGGHGKAKIAKSARLFRPGRSRTNITEFMRTDPVCKKLLSFDWNDPASAPAPRDVAEHLRHLVAAKDRGLLTRRQIGFLLNYERTQVGDRILAYRRSLETPEERQGRERREAFWAGEIVRLYAQRRPGETTKEFYDRASTDERYPFPWIAMVRTLQRAGVLPAQIARKAHRKLPAEKKGKLEKAGVTVGGK